MKVKFKNPLRTEQSKNGELGLIIDEFGRAMWRADRSHIAKNARMTPNMEMAWAKFVQFCVENPK